jgi:phosphoglycerate dehydrogenase-like enzyme
MLGAVCTGLRRRPELGIPSGCTKVFGLAELDALLPEHDLLVLAAPATSETQSLVTPERLDRLPRGAIVAYVARGALLAEAALADRIALGKLRGAVLDVFEDEPLSADSPLWDLPSVIITPHIAGVSPGNYWPRQIELLLDNWRRFAAGEAQRNLVDLTAGY